MNEKQLEQAGYRFLKEFNDPEKAKQKAKEYRKAGYYARVVKTSTRVKGYYTYNLYIKNK